MRKRKEAEEKVVFRKTIAKDYGVSTPTVTRWIAAASEGKNKLQIKRVGTRYEVINNKHNVVELTDLAKDSARYQQRFYHEVKPNDAFYEIFSDEEILEIIQDLKSRNVLNLKYTYKGEGAREWAKVYKDKDYKTPNTTVELLEYLPALLEIHLKNSDCEQVNIVDIGPGDGSPVRDLLNSLKKRGILNKYVALDISNSMLKAVKVNLGSWIPGMEIVSFRCDIEKDWVYPVLFENKDGKRVCNVILELGGTIGNHDYVEDVLRSIRSAMEREDLFFIDSKVLNKKNVNDGAYLLAPDQLYMSTWVFSYMGIDIRGCDFEYAYNKDKNQRYISMTVDKDYIVNFEVFGKKQQLSFEKGSRVRIWNHHPLDFHRVIDWCKECQIRINSINTSRDRAQSLISFAVDNTESF